MDINKTLAERGERYGSFDSHAFISQQLKVIVAESANDEMLPFQREALEMIMHKIARILNGDPNYIDGWRDICGYSQLVINQLMKTCGATDARVVRQIVVDGVMQDVVE